MGEIQIEEIGRLAANIRVLSADAVQRANSGHPGLPLGMAELAATLYTRVLHHYPGDPQWAGRDRFVLSAGHGSMLLYSILHLCGYELSMEELTQFRQYGSKTPGHPEFGVTPGVETTTGPLGQGLSNAVGMAMEQEHLAARYNRPGHEIFSYHTYVLVGDGCMMEGITSEAASLAGHLGLGRLICFYDSNAITIEGSTELAFSESVADRFRAYGWQVLEADPYDSTSILRAVDQAKAVTTRPSLIVLPSIIGKGAEGLEGSHKVHGAPLGAEAVAKMKTKLGFDPAGEFQVSAKVSSHIQSLQGGWKASWDDWNARLTAWAEAYPELAREYRSLDSQIPQAEVAWPDFEPGKSIATRKANGAVMQAVAQAYPGLLGGSADLSPSTNTTLTEYEDFSPQNPQGRNLHFGVREHAMAGIMNGLAASGRLRPFGSTFLTFSDYLRPSIRLAALSKIAPIYVFTHDSFYVGEDGPTHQPIEHICSLRAIIDHVLIRPGDAQECIAAWQIALEIRDKPVSLLMTRQNLEVYPKPEGWLELARRGAYQVHQTGSGSPDLTVLATGSEVSLSLESAKLLGLNIRVVSILSLELVGSWSSQEQQALFGPLDRRVAVEASRGMSWHAYIIPGNTYGIDSYCASAPGEVVAEKIGFTPQALADWLAERAK
ncbi:transketolase [Spirochaeta lutea]|uniref:Transketolase n=1 Tax=Spirochaeta lutea TaxID=1480694 RepID=A0A098QUH4_9SPIO|nr:transketolase [Spirochaeta lutea]KGE71231.1 hypothetical protein DC28_12305 [Spirochaeta lutea]